MAQDFSKSFYNSKAWKTCRDAYIGKRIILDGGMCEKCKQEPGYILHHKVVLTEQNINNKDITLNHCNLEYVCKVCHEKTHYEIEKGKNFFVSFDSNGQIVPTRT